MPASLKHLCHLSTALLLGLLTACASAPQQAASHAPQERFRDTLRDGSPGPQLVVVAAGHFIMGSPESEAGRYADEGPQHPVTITRPFAVGDTEVTVGEFRRFVQASGYHTTAEGGEGSFFRDPASGQWRLEPRLNWRFDSAGQPAQDNLPVVHVSWDDAQAYVRWLSEQTGQRYRLPSEAELEYINRAGSQASFQWGEGSPPAPMANIKGELDQAVTPKNWWQNAQEEIDYAFREGDTPRYFSGYRDGHGSPAPVASFLPNAFGLHDTVGNVWEWAQDCWHDNYLGAPDDGSAWEDSGECPRRVIRGASWYCYPRHVRAANRWSGWPIFRNMYIGFRVAREL